MALADIKIKTEGPAQIPTYVEINGQDVTNYVRATHVELQTGEPPMTVVTFLGAAEVEHDPDTIPFLEDRFQPDEPVQEQEGSTSEEIICTCSELHDGENDLAPCPIHGNGWSKVEPESGPDGG